MARNAERRPQQIDKPGSDKPRSPERKLAGPAIILLAAVVAIWPMLVAGPSCGSDFYFHYVSWVEAQRSILQGILYPHWANSPNFGAGEPRFVFYPPLSWMAGAWMGLVLPWKAVALALSFLLLAATGLANRALARAVLGEGAATLAGCAAIFLGRSLSDVSQMGNYGELTGGFWIPLLLLFLLQSRNSAEGFWERAFDGSTAPLALVVAGIWLSNGPLGIEATYLLAAVALVSAAVQKSWAPVARAAVAYIVGLGVASVYLVPAFWERSWVNLHAAIAEPQYLIENNWLFAHLTDPTVSAATLSIRNNFIRTVSVIAVAMFALTLIAALVAWKRGTLPRERRWWIPLSLIPCAVVFLFLPVSLPLWNSLPGLRLLQFPARWLLVMQPSLAVFFAAAVWVVPVRRRIAILVACALVFLTIGTVTWGFCRADCGKFDSLLKVWEAQGRAAGKPEYSPAGVQYQLVLPDVPRNCVVSELNDLKDISGPPGDGLQPVRPGTESLCRSAFTETVHRPEYKEITGVAAQAGYLILPLRSFPAWKATVNGHPVPTLMEPGHGLMAVPVSPGPVSVTVRWTATADGIAGRWLSAAGLCLLGALVWLERKLSLRPSS